MLYTELKPIEEILESLKEDKDIFLISCGGCPEACQTGGEKELIQIKKTLEEKGKNITGKVLIDFLCNKTLAGLRLSRYKEEIDKSTAVLVLSCGIGVQAISKVVSKPTYPALNTVSLGGFQGLWPSEERCEECGNCVLDLTGGICPVTFCSKSLLNGACGGSKDGKCEVDPERDCGWALIYERLKKMGRLERLKGFTSARNYQKMLPSQEIRNKPSYDIEK